MNKLFAVLTVSGLALMGANVQAQDYGVTDALNQANAKVDAANQKVNGTTAQMQQKVQARQAQVTQAQANAEKAKADAANQKVNDATAQMQQKVQARQAQVTQAQANAEKAKADRQAQLKQVQDNVKTTEDSFKGLGDNLKNSATTGY